MRRTFETMNPVIPVKGGLTVNAEEANKRRKIGIISFSGGIIFLVLFFLLVIYGKIVLSGPYQPQYLPMFPQKLEFVMRYQALGLMPIAVNVVIVMVLRVMDPLSSNEPLMQRWIRPLNNSFEQFLLSTVIQLVMAANLEAQAILAYPPFMAICFFIGRIVYMSVYPYGHQFGHALCFIPSLIAILFNGYGAVRFVFS